MSFATEKIREKAIIESIVNKDIDSFVSIYQDIIKDEYDKLVKARFNEMEGIK